MTTPVWVEKLKPLVDKDLHTRNVLLERGILNDAYHSELEKIHLKNATELKILIEKSGFPLLSNAGDEGVRLSWLIILHAISLPEFMRSCLLEMRLGASLQDYPLDLLAYVEDRVSFLEGRKQLYGTHFDWISGDFRPTPIEDPEGIQIRRKSMGLPPLKIDSYLISTERPPRDPLKKQRDFVLWLMKVGWRS
jgi:hypothetical protein